MDERHRQAGIAAAPSLVRTPATLLDGRDVLLSVARLLLFVLLVVAIFTAEGLLLSLLGDRPALWQRPMQPVRTLGDSLLFAMLAVAVTVATWVLAAREHRSFADYGWRSLHPVRNLFGGSLAGVALLSATVLLLHQMDLLVFRGQVLFGAAQQWKLAFEWLAFYALAAYVEQFLAHGYLQYALTRALSGFLRRSFAASLGVDLAFWIAAVLLCSAVALFHGLGSTQNHLAMLSAALFSLLMVFSLWRTGSLWWALGYHMAWDWAQSFLWGVPNAGARTRVSLFYTEATGPALRSGGPIGPEGSVYMLGALGAAFGILMLLHKRRVYPELWTEAANLARHADVVVAEPTVTSTATN